MTKLSVIMPVYNAEKYLKESIESVLNQTYSNFEFIIINDGSTDKSLDIIRNYEKIDDRIILVSRQNKGLVNTLNEGIELANSPYIARMDADDICEINRFEKQMEFLQKNLKFDVIGSCVNVIGNITSNSLIEKYLNKDINDNFREGLLTYWYCFAHSSVIMKKETIVRVGKYKENRAEDLELWLRILKNGGKIVKLHEKLIYFRVNDQSKSSIENKNSYLGIKDGIKVKILDVFTNHVETKFEYLIWGAGNGGRITKEIIEEILPKSKCIGFIDKYKKGNIDEVKIYNAEDIMSIKFEYIFVATEPGKEEVIKNLQKLNLVNIKDYLCTI